MKANEKKVRFSYRSNEKQWVGDGFHVHGLIRPSEELNDYISPFVLLDYASPKEFSPTSIRRGVGEHPHRGFETVTLAYQGEIEHRDSAGGGGVISPGDVQWMTAGKGVVHDEFHSKNFSKKGGIFEMVQLWVNLPKISKMTDPKYQEIRKSQIPTAALGGFSQIRVLAGEYHKVLGPASTFTPINMYDILSREDDKFSLKLKAGTNTILLVMDGHLVFNERKFVDKTVLIFEREGDELKFETSKNFKGLVLNADPLNESVVAHGPFVMNTKEEISQAMSDFKNGNMGKLIKEKK